MTRLNDITGMVFGRLTAIAQNGRSRNGKVLWKCSCSCGNELNVISGALVSGNTKSCGCYKKDVQAVCNKTHGMSYSKEYGNWADMRKRCLQDNENHADYFDRGITVHPDFDKSFEAWFNEIGLKPVDGQRWSVGRIDNDVGYTYGNLRWEVDAQQARNHSKQRNNTSGITGVQYSKKDNSWVAQWRPLTGNNKQKYFSVTKFGYEDAKAFAIAYRNKMIKELNEQGAGYADSHGSDK